ncbi:MAG: 2-succinyl-5-enolpyruvyl-6-hydroxy-3-cyclohexene-1-carboxylic-acid synthase [Anaerolineales bacterium]|nr:2-succinyl-5-enolpyruvyl-6-hydroxy-3-cyclohexene-1-carboxylic-acid synthase [Anaerolineales bacterium]
MTAPNRSTLWAEIFVDELARAGLRYVCIAPGSRSTPLTIAFFQHADISVHSLLDERSAGFFALGMALASSQPVAVVCTSGTAASNFHPAVTEAYYAQIPLLVLTTDRPHELRHSGSNQTIDQLKMFGDHVRWFVDVGLPEADPSPLTMRSLRTLAARAVATTQGLPPGPVHLNLPFRKPLEPIPDSNDMLDQLRHDRVDGRINNLPFTRISQGNVAPSAEQIELLLNAIQNAPKGLIICGPRCDGNDFPQAISKLAQVTQYPILADALSGVRFGPHLNQNDVMILGSYETFLQSEITSRWESPDLIIRFGAMPTSKALGDHLATWADCRQIAISGSGLWQDDTHMLTHYMWADPAMTCRFVASQLRNIKLKNGSWRTQFEQAEKTAQEVFAKNRDETYFEGAILADVVDLLPIDALLYVASSLPVRHLDQFVPPDPKNLRVFANRGASGIDGTIASALGASKTTDYPLVLVIGDLAFYHDMNSLLALQRNQVKATIVLINNNGGGIFHRLPIANFDPPFTELFVTPHGLTFEPVVRMFGADYTAVTSRTEFRQTLQESIAAPTSRVIEVQTDSVLHEKLRRKIINKVTQKLT